MSCFWLKMVKTSFLENIQGKKASNCLDKNFEILATVSTHALLLRLLQCLGKMSAWAQISGNDLFCLHLENGTKVI